MAFQFEPAKPEDDDTPKFFPADTETRRLAEKFAPTNPLRASVEAKRAIEEAMWREPHEPERPKVPDVSGTLVARKKVHGEFANDARTAQGLKHVMRDGVNWDDLTFVQKEALEHIQTRIARILSGDPNHPDHWHDIQGFARLVEERL